MRARFFDSSIRFFRPVATIVQPIAAVPTIDISCGSRAIPRYRQETAELKRLRRLRRAARVRVRGEVRLPAAPVGDVRVALGRGEVGVPEHLLHGAEVGAALEQVGRERVAEQVRVDALGLEPGLLGELAQDEERAGARRARRRGR